MAVGEVEMLVVLLRLLLAVLVMARLDGAVEEEEKALRVGGAVVLFVLVPRVGMVFPGKK